MAARRSAQPLYWVYLARVINIPAVQCHREAVTDDRTAQFFSEGCRPDTLDFQWSLDEPDLSFWEPVARPSVPFRMQAWNAAFVAFLGFINALAFGELIASGVNPKTGARREIDPVEWMRTGLILDVRNGDLIEVSQGKRTVRWSAITLRAVKATPPTEARGHGLTGRERGPTTLRCARRAVGLDEVSAGQEATVAGTAQAVEDTDRAIVRVARG